MLTKFNKRPLPRRFYERDTLIVAQELLGCYLVRKIDNNYLIGKIVETECYRAHDDPACHAFKGKTPRTESLFGQPGHAYVYFIYGNHYCFNAVAHEQGFAGGVLIRALEPLYGIEYMQQLRPNVALKSLTNGPGKLAQALQINKQLYGIDLTSLDALYITSGEAILPGNIASSSRIGLSKGVDYHWRFFLKDNAYVSKAPSIKKS